LGAWSKVHIDHEHAQIQVEFAMIRAQVANTSCQLGENLCKRMGVDGKFQDKITFEIKLSAKIK
jgi:hypothetical protein